MRKLFCDLTRAITLVVCMIIFSSNNAISQVKYRHCTIKEIFDNGGYTYMRCYDGTDDLWLATPQKWFEYGEKVTFEDMPAMVNFRSKTLGMTFPLIRFTQVMKFDPQKRNSSDSDTPSNTNKKTTTSHNEDVYSGTDDDGTLVFSDDPSKVKNIKEPNGKTKSKRNDRSTVRSNVSETENGGNVSPDSTRKDWGINNTPAEKFSHRDSEVIAVTENVIKAICKSDRNALKSLMYKPAWDEYVMGKGKNIDDAMVSFLRACPKTFIVNKVKYNDQEKSATVRMVGEVDFNLGNDYRDDGLTAIFKNQKGKWKFLFMSNSDAE